MTTRHSILLVSGMAAGTVVASSCTTVPSEDKGLGAGAGAGAAFIIQEAAESSPADLAECVRVHVQRCGGNARAVTRLDCPLPAPTSCDDVPPPDLTPLAPLENLRSLDLRGRCIVDVRPIAALRRLERVQLADNQVSDIRPLGALGGLVALGLRNNPLTAPPPWGFKTKEPFSRWSRLEELDLDYIRVVNLLPLETLTSLRHLSVRGNDLFAVRLLRSLVRLKTLHIDETLIEDLAPLSALKQLEELTLDGNSVRTVEPLRALLPRNGGRLRKVSLRANCAASCDALAGTQHDCSDQIPENDCGRPERTAPAGALSVPIDQVDQYAPTHLPIWAPAQLAAAFELVRAAPDIQWDKPRGNCDGRAGEVAALLRAHGFPEFTRAFAFGNLRPLTSNDPGGFVSFDWHVAIAVRARLDDNRGPEYFVLDAAFEPARPLALREWYARLVDSRGANLNFSCVDYWRVERPDAAEEICRQNTVPVFVGLDGKLAVDEPRQLRGSVCYQEACFPL
jgi:Leucine-rich repeat (LRR) protein